MDRNGGPRDERSPNPLFSPRFAGFTSMSALLAFADAALEREIEAAKERMCAATTREEKLTHWREMVRLIDQRTPEQVKALEAQRGLRT